MKAKRLRSDSFLGKTSLCSYTGEMCLLTPNNKRATHISTCKEEMYFAVSRDIAWGKFKKPRELNIIDETLPGSRLIAPIDKKAFRFCFSVHGKENRKMAANRILKVLEMLSKRLRLKKKPSVSFGLKTNNILILADKWFLRSPVSVSAILTFIRAAALSTFPFSNLEEFIDRTINGNILIEDDDYDDYHGDFDADADAAHLGMARENGTLEKFLSKKLKCLNRRGFSDNKYYFEHVWDGFTQFGIAEYDDGEKPVRVTFSRLKEECEWYLNE